MKQLSLFLILMIMPTLVLAGINGKISGTVVDAETGDPLAGTNVLVVGTSLGASTDADGKYNILSVPIGTYSVKATFIGYTEITYENIKVNSDITTRLSFSLGSSAVSGESIIIIAETPLVNITSTNVVRTMDANLIENIATRNVTELFALQAGVVVQNNEVSIRGGRPNETGYQVEGVSTDAAVGAAGMMFGSRSTTDNSQIGGENPINIIPEALEEVRVLVGGFSADIGGGAAGIIQQTFKTGRESFHGSLRYETDGAAESFGETESYGYNDLTAVISGPLGALKYFGAVQVSHADDYNPQYFTGADFGKIGDTGDDGGNTEDTVVVSWDTGKVPGRNDDRTTFNGTLQWDMNPIIFRFNTAYTTRERTINTSPIRRLFNEGRLPKRDDLNMLVSGKASYFLSENTVINAKVSLFKYDWQIYDPNFIKDGEFDMANQLDSGDGDSVVEVDTNWVYDSRYVNPRWYNLDGFRFDRPGRLVTGYFKREQSYLDFEAGFVAQRGNHEIRGGASARTWEIREYSFSGTQTISLNSQIGVDPTLRADLISGTEAARLLLRRGQTGGYGYDEFGDKVDSGPDDAKRPSYTSLYLNDKIEFDDLIINFGIRLDNFDLDTWHLADSADPGYNKEEATIDLTENDKAESSTEIQPRFGLAFPISERMVFHLQYGKFAQAPDLVNAYAGRSNMAFAMGGGVFIPNPIGFDLEPIVATQYEIGFNYQFADEASFDITAFYKNTEGQLTIAQYKINPGQPGGDYNVYVNGDFAVTKGLEFTLRTRRLKRTQTLLNYTLSSAKGTNSFPNSRLSSTEREITPPTYITPLRYEQKHKGSLILDYRMSGQDGGYANLFANSGINLLLNFNSGHSFTHSSGGLGQRRADTGALLNDRDPRVRTPSEPIGDSTTPWVFTTDMKVDKLVSLGNINAQIYVLVSNLFNRRNVINVYNRTGDAYDDGFLTDPELSEKVVAGLGENYVPLYRAINLENRQHWINDRGFDLFGEPRQIQVGVKIDF